LQSPRRWFPDIAGENGDGRVPSVNTKELLGCRVDVLTDGGISPYLRDHIYAEAVPL